MAFFSRRTNGAASVELERMRDQAGLIARGLDELHRSGQQLAEGAATQTRSLDQALGGANELAAQLKETLPQVESADTTLQGFQAQLDSHGQPWGNDDLGGAIGAISNGCESGWARSARRPSTSTRSTC